MATNEAGEDLLLWCEANNKALVNSFMKHQNRGTWFTYIWRRWYELDGIIMRQDQSHRNLSGKRRAGSTKEQTEEESARIGTEVLGTADRGVQGSEQRWKYRNNVRRPEKAGKERTQGNRRNNNNKREVQGAFRETDRRKIREPERRNRNSSKWGDEHTPGTTSNGGKWFIEWKNRWRGNYQSNEEYEGIHPGKGISKNYIHEGIRRRDAERIDKDGSIYVYQQRAQIGGIIEDGNAGTHIQEGRLRGGRKLQRCGDVSHGQPTPCSSFDNTF